MILAEPRGKRYQRGQSDQRQILGRSGESLAAQALVSAGMTILDRRFRMRLGEIDLIAVDRDVLVFVEVKTRSSYALGAPAEAVTKSKQRRLGTVALAYLTRRGWLDRPTRFDVVEVLLPVDGSESVRHIVDAFRLDG